MISRQNINQNNSDAVVVYFLSCDFCHENISIAKIERKKIIVYKKSGLQWKQEKNDLI
jgi:hypothetical protein